ncbi:isopenicillin N synthase family dioxygenase [Prosthecomicrobium pneumaticum]|nr:isopenicillin N synthase family oxygenase [Prosthecomicrobium pneumaticum]
MKLAIVDLEPFRLGDEAARKRVARAFGEAFETTGFAVIVGHGVPETLAGGLYEAVTDFFLEPYDTKAAYTPPEQTKGRGYLPVGIESVAKTLSGETPPDLCEALVFTAPHRENAAGARPNIWPAEPARLAGLIRDWTREMVALTGHLMQLSALALDLPEDHFAQAYRDPSLVLRFVNYPDQETPPRPGQMRYGEHHDYGALTILRQDSAPGGLEIKDRDGVWKEAGVVPDSFVINVGDLMARWTNNRWRSTLHRVSNPDRGLTGSTRRLSLVAFTGPNEHAEVACLPSCADAEHPALFEPVKAGDYIRAKLDASMQLSTGR